MFVAHGSSIAAVRRVTKDGKSNRAISRLEAALILFVSLSPRVAAQSTSRLLLQVGAECGLSVISATHSELVTTGTESEYRGAITFVYQIRTSLDAGSGAIRLHLVDNPSLAGASLTYTTVLTGNGSAVPEEQTITFSSPPGIVATFGSNQASPKEDNGGVINWTLRGQARLFGHAIPPNLKLTIACR
ncbi:MAG TPA: hypothetical protein VK776_28045 [Bryobacteraceae bacterium]|nr:hypothetical protein [Bryobacteraceae bacterium]